MRRAAVGLPLILLFALHGALAAQAPPTSGAVRGVVRGEVGQPLPAASVTLRSSSDTTEVRTTVGSSAGAFAVSGVPPGRYLLTVSVLGYRSHRVDGLEVPTGGVDLGEIRLEAEALELEGVAVEAERGPQALLADRTVYHTSSMPVAGSGTATDLLRALPELEVDLEGRVRARGAAPRIFIDGRPAPMEGEALQRYLQQLPASRIERVEVIPNPSARYEAEGMGGIVNIVMKQGASVGLSGSLATNASTQNQNSLTGRLNYQEGRVTLFGGGSLSTFGQTHSATDVRRNLLARPVTSLVQDSRSTNRGGFGTGDLTAELRVGARGTAWLQGRASLNDWGSESDLEFTHLDERDVAFDRYDRRNVQGSDRSNAAALAGYRSVVQAQRDEWSVEIRRSRSDSENEVDSDRVPLELPGAGGHGPTELTRDRGMERQVDQSAQFDLIRPWGTGKVEVGYRGSSRDIRDSFGRTISSGADPFPQTYADAFEYREELHAGYLSADRRVAGLDVQLGVRAERASTRFALPLSDDGGGVERSGYRSVFPNVNLSRSFGSGQQLRLSYAKRVDRPWPWILNPNDRSADPFNRWMGNPYLTPRYTHSFSLDASRTGSFGTIRLSPYYRHTTDSFEQLRIVDESGVATMTWFNLATLRSYGTSLNGSVRRVGPLGGFANVNLFREMREGPNVSEEFASGAVRMSLNTNLTVAASPTLNGQVSANYWPARDMPQGRVSGVLFTTFAVRKQLLERRGAVNVSVTDPFDLARQTMTTRDEAHVQVMRSSFSMRRASVGLTYSFGRPPQSARRPGGDAEGQPGPDAGPPGPGRPGG